MLDNQIWIPKKLITLFEKKPEYLLPEAALGIGEEVYNGIIHIVQDKNNKTQTQKVFNILKEFTPNIEKLDNQMLANLISFFKMEPNDLADLLLSCGKEIIKLKDTFAGFHLGKMKTLRNPNGFDYPFFEGPELQIGMIMGIVAKKMRKKIIITESVYQNCSNNTDLRFVKELTLKNGNQMKIFEL